MLFVWAGVLVSRAIICSINTCSADFWFDAWSLSANTDTTPFSTSVFMLSILSEMWKSVCWILSSFSLVGFLSEGVALVVVSSKEKLWMVS